jgi:hypothetical protein
MIAAILIFLWPLVVFALIALPVWVLHNEYQFALAKMAYDQTLQNEITKLKILMEFAERDRANGRG